MPEYDENFQLSPIFANSVITITKSGAFHQVLTYDYSEPTGQYFKLVQLDDEFYEKEIENLSINMQNYMDSCVNKINDAYVKPEVIETEIDFKEEVFPFYYWVITFKGELKEGINVYESTIEKDTLEYNISSIYILEKPLIPISVESTLNYDILKEQRIVKYWAETNDSVGPTEILRFKL
ncbi:MAG: hypothetical protein GF364_02195 [Candidatus Lokiarchaeota archaeon]|nr:hypothetical protein [Candidatus Lokiarchaeota archaeon]